MSSPSKSTPKSRFQLVAGVLAACLLVLAILFSLSSWQTESFKILERIVFIAAPLANIAFVAIGLSAGLLLACAWDKKQINEEHKQIWQAQDAKLLNEVTSDKEKQLTAKIATLEAALKNALKNK